MWVKVLNSEGNFVPVRAFVDDGSTVSLVSSYVANKLKLPKFKTFKIIKSADNTKLRSILYETNLILQNMDESLDSPYEMKEVGITSVSLSLPQTDFHFCLPEGLAGKVSLADPQCNTPAGVDILVCAGDWSQMKLENSVKFNKIRLQNSIFGFIVQGFSHADNNPSFRSVSVVLKASDWAGIKDDLRSIFEFTPLKEECDDYAETVFREQHERDKITGLFKVPILWQGNKTLGDSYKICAARNSKTLNKLSDSDKKEFVNILLDYKAKGIISICDSSPMQGKCYLPLVIVKKTDKLTCKLRICLDASQRTSNGLSYNDLQFTGKKLTPDIGIQLLRFRQHPVALTADVQLMYLSIRVKDEDADYQRTVINFDGYQTQEIQYNSLIFGGACSANLALACVQQLASDEAKHFPLGSEILKHNSYVDDISASLSSVTQGEKAASELIEICAKGGLSLHKMASNKPTILRKLDDKFILSSIKKERDSMVLGLQWFHDSDLIAPIVRIEDISTIKLTKRLALSLLAKFYDPLGLLTPFFIQGRFLIQEIWLLDRELSTEEFANSWDRELTPELDEVFRIWYNGLKGIEKIEIPRFSGFDVKKHQSLFMFADASSKGFGACVYLRTLPPSGDAHFTLLIAKGKTAPILKDNLSLKLKALTIPRLELSGAVLGSDLVHKVKLAWNLEDFPVFAFVDSEIVLAMISGYSMRDVFSENRLRHLRKLVKRDEWFFVPTESNPADIVSRGSTVRDVDPMWLSGPTLMKDRNFVPVNKFFVEPPSEVSEIDIILSSDKKLNDEVCKGDVEDFADDVIATIANDEFFSKDVSSNSNNTLNQQQDLPSTTEPTEEGNNDDDFGLLSRFSSFKKTVRITAVVLLAISLFRQKKKHSKILAKNERRVDNLRKITGEDITRAKVAIIKATQRKYFPSELKTLSEKRFVDKGSFKNKNLFIDNEGIMRSGSRIQSPSFAWDFCNPIILPSVGPTQKRVNHIAFQILLDSHLNNMHAGPVATQTDVNQQYYTRNLARALKRLISHCQVCIRHRAKVQTQIMAELPEVISRRSPAFRFISLDYLGPVNLKTRAKITRSAANDDNPRSMYGKAWIMLIVCLTTRAYHIEVIADLTSESFLRGFSNFCSTRGYPEAILSDNASTFKRAADMLDDLFATVRRSLEEGQKAVQSKAAELGIRWRFTIPTASHTNGIVERGNRSIRDKLNKSIGAQKLSFPDLHSLMKRIEGLLNSRPLLKGRSNSSEGEFVITPAHLLLGRSVNQLPSITFPTKNVTMKEAFKIKQEIEDNFWDRFHIDHLNELKDRQKWFAPQRQPQVGDLVLLIDNNIKSNQWQKGVVDQVFPGKDGFVRSCKLRVASLDQKSFGTKTFDRPISKLVLLCETLDLNAYDDQNKANIDNFQ